MNEDQLAGQIVHLMHRHAALELRALAHVLRIPTLEGVMTAEHGDWIIRGIKGEFYPCKPDIFTATYEPAPHA